MNYENRSTISHSVKEFCTHKMGEHEIETFFACTAVHTSNEKRFPDIAVRIVIGSSPAVFGVIPYDDASSFYSTDAEAIGGTVLKSKLKEAFFQNYSESSSEGALHHALFEFFEGINRSIEIFANRIGSEFLDEKPFTLH